MATSVSATPEPPRDADPVAALEDEPPGRVVIDLAGHRVEMEPHFEPLDLAKIHRQEVEEERPIGFRGKGNESPFLLRPQDLMDHLDVRGLAGKTRNVKDE